MTYHYMGEYEQAVEWLTKCLEVSSPEESHVRKAYALLAVSQRELGQTEACLKTLEQGLAITPEDPELHFHAAHTLTSAGRLAEAQAHYLKGIGADLSGHFSSVDRGILGYKSYHNLGGLCLALGQYKEARQWWGKAIEAAPGFLPSCFDLFQAALEVEDFGTARRMLRRVSEVEGPSENWAKMGVHYQESLSGNGQGEVFLRRAIETHPQATGPRLMLARRLLESGRVGEAQEHLTVLNEQGVAEAAYCLGVAATCRGDFGGALAGMERAQALNPQHEPTHEQVTHLRRLVGVTPEPPESASGEEAGDGEASTPPPGDGDV